MPTRRLSQRVLTLSLPKVNCRKRREMRYFCVLTRRCALMASSERKNWARRNSPRVALYPQTRRPDDRVAGRPVRGRSRPVRKKSQRRMQRADRADWSGDESHNFRLRRAREGAIHPVRARAVASRANLTPQQTNTWRCLSVIPQHDAAARKREGSCGTVDVIPRRSAASAIEISRCIARYSQVPNGCRTWRMPSHAIRRCEGFFFWLWSTGRRALPSRQERKIPCWCFPEIDRDDDTDRGRSWAERIRRARRARTDRRERDLSQLSAARRVLPLHCRRSVGRPRRPPQGLYDRRRGARPRSPIQSPNRSDRPRRGAPPAARDGTLLFGGRHR